LPEAYTDGSNARNRSSNNKKKKERSIKISKTINNLD